MVEHMGQGCGLSFLIVAVFAVLLHERDAPTPPPVSEAKAPVSVVEPPRTNSPSVTRAPLVVTTPATSETPPAPPHPEPVESPSPRPAKPPEVPLPSPARVLERREPTAARPTPHPPKAKPKSILRNPESDFTQVGAGETLESIATRVYGTSEAVDTLWRSNRDQVVTRDRPLEPGIWLRTPPCPEIQARLGRR